ncbi:translation initiation factor eIF-2B subunit beta-like [Saccostrea cucullata]|uniref:translation initiation factor eIF-2B subunit beta-like n=1 Tax=Saccostrea cuccullata TaxID=36930 RepID=UPI002ED21900
MCEKSTENMPSGDTEKADELNEKLDAFARDLKQGSIEGSYNVAYRTVSLLRIVIAQSKCTSAKDVMANVIKEGKRLMAAQLTETAVGNMVRRVLKIIREEYASALRGKSEEGDPKESLHKMLLAGGEIDDFSQPVPNLKASVLDAISELIIELEIRTAGKSRTVEAFLKKAAKKRKFQVIVVECAPFFHGQKLAVSLARANIETTVINDSAVFAIMSRVNKVIIGTHTVMANGGLKAVNGSHAIALAAKHYSVPLLVCAAMFKLSPQYLCSYDQDAFNKFVSPKDVMNFEEGEIASKVQIDNPVFDYVPPELVTLYVSNIGGNAPSYVYRLLSEFYHPDDHEL